MHAHGSGADDKGPQTALPGARSALTLLLAGTYCIDYGAKKISLGTDPTGHTMSYSGDSGTGELLQFAFEQTTNTDGPRGHKLAQAVTLMDLQVSQYAHQRHCISPTKQVRRAQASS